MSRIGNMLNQTQRLPSLASDRILAGARDTLDDREKASVNMLKEWVILASNKTCSL